MALTLEQIAKEKAALKRLLDELVEDNNLAQRRERLSPEALLKKFIEQRSEELDDEAAEGEIDHTLKVAIKNELPQLARQVFEQSQGPVRRIRAAPALQARNPAGQQHKAPADNHWLVKKPTTLESLQLEFNQKFAGKEGYKAKIVNGVLELHFPTEDAANTYMAQLQGAHKVQPANPAPQMARQANPGAHRPHLWQGPQQQPRLHAAQRRQPIPAGGERREGEPAPRERAEGEPEFQPQNFGREEAQRAEGQGEGDQYEIEFEGEGEGMRVGR